MFMEKLALSIFSCEDTLSLQAGVAREADLFGHSTSRSSLLTLPDSSENMFCTISYYSQLLVSSN